MESNNKSKALGMRRSRSVAALLVNDVSKKPLAMRRPKTHSELLSRGGANKEKRDGGLVLVTVSVWAQSIWPVRALVSDEATVEAVIKAAMDVYSREQRRPALSRDPSSFALHLSQFSFHPLDPSERIKELGGFRSFFMRPSAPNGGLQASCALSDDKVCGMPWYRHLLHCLPLAS